MSVSQPSREIYVVDVPEIKEFTANYRYNFFVPDESVNETGGIPASALSRAGAEVDSQFIQYSITRVPRFIHFQWTKPKLADIGNLISELAHRENTFRMSSMQKGSLILDNLDKIANEDNFSSNNYASVHFHDGEIDNKIHELVSGSIVAASLEQESDQNVSHYRSAQRLIPMLPSYVKPHFIFRAMAQPEKAYGGTFYLPGPHNPKAGMSAHRTSTPVFDNYYRRLRKVTTNTQINTKFMHDLVNRTIKDPAATNAQDLVSIHSYSKSMKQAANQRFSPALSEHEFKTFVPFIQVRKHGVSPHSEKYGSEIVGYVIDKFEVLKNGTTKSHPPIVIDNAHVNVTADFQIKFNSTYCYTIRTIALLTMPAIDDESGEVATVKVLISSKPSNKIYVSTLKLNPPPPPADVNFIWNYETSKLLMTWAFPVTSERDIKQFQVFRRDSIDHAFELQKVYNFDDSLSPFPPAEYPDPRLVERVKSPATFWVDDEFDWNVHNSEEAGRIYTVCSIDAHAQTSNYAGQYLIWFDKFKNQLQKKLVSHGGAPKPYPNMYLQGHLFDNTIRVQGAHSKRMKVYFNPEYYYLTDDQNRMTKVVQTKQTGGGYKLQFINIDSLKSAVLDITIDDRTLLTTRKMSYPNVRFGPKRKASSSKLT